VSTAQASYAASRFLDALAQHDFDAVGDAEIGDDGIAWMNLLCSGERPAD
jgi:hypothetical protein